MFRLVLLWLIACTPAHGPELLALPPSPCETPELEAPTAGPPRLDAFVAAYTTATPEARADLLSKLVTPLVDADGTAAFVYAGSGGEHEVRVIGDFKPKSFTGVDWDSTGIALTEVADRLWIARARFRSDARFDYRLVIDGKAGPDPRNPHEIMSGVADGPASELALPQAPAAHLRQDVPHGTVSLVDEPWAKPKIAIYLPPGYDKTRRYRALYTADGSAWIDQIRLPQLLDDRIARRAIEPVIAVMIDSAPDRRAWYAWNPDYLAYLDRVVAYVDSHYATRAERSGRVHVGTSAGGRASLQVAMFRGSTFGGIAMLSPSLGGSPYIYEPLFGGHHMLASDLRVWMSAGRYEGAICEDVATMSRFMQSTGIATRVIYSREGHSFGTWRHAAAEMLPYFFGR